MTRRARRLPSFRERERGVRMIEAVDDVMVHTSGAGAKRNFLGVLGISGVEGRPAAVSAWR